MYAGKKSNYSERERECARMARNERRRDRDIERERDNRDAIARH